MNINPTQNTTIPGQVFLDTDGNQWLCTSLCKDYDDELYDIEKTIEVYNFGWGESHDGPIVARGCVRLHDGHFSWHHLPL